MVRTTDRSTSSEVGALVADTADICGRIWSCFTRICNPFAVCNGNCGTQCGNPCGGIKLPCGVPKGGCSCSGGCGCDDTCQPCWYPEQLDDIVLDACPGSTVRIRFRVFNRSIEPRRFVLAATGPDAHRAFGAPSTLDLGPWERGWLVARIRVPEGIGPNERLELLLWVRGCRDHVTAVVLTACEDDCSPLVDREITDAHHDCHSWRDHFYAATPCPARSRQQGAVASG